MNHFEHRDGVLYAEDVPVPEIAKAVGTPFYVYSTATLERHYKVFSKAFEGVDALVCYAMKANSGPSGDPCGHHRRRLQRADGRGLGRQPQELRRHGAVGGQEADRLVAAAELIKALAGLISRIRVHKGG